MALPFKVTYGVGAVLATWAAPEDPPLEHGGQTQRVRHRLHP
jgi:hypothetical protein